MRRTTRYYTLIGSLPALPTHVEQAERVPISKLQLDERLKMLEPADAAVIDEMRDFLAWERQPVERTDEEVLEHYEHFVNTVGQSICIGADSKRTDSAYDLRRTSSSTIGP